MTFFGRIRPVPDPQNCLCPRLFLLKFLCLFLRPGLPTPTKLKALSSLPPQTSPRSTKESGKRVASVKQQWRLAQRQPLWHLWVVFYFTAVVKCLGLSNVYRYRFFHTIETLLKVLMLNVQILRTIPYLVFFFSPKISISVLLSRGRKQNVMYQPRTDNLPLW